MGKDETGSVTIEDRFYDFITKDFPNFRVESAEQWTDVGTQLVGVNGRLKKLEKKVDIDGSKTNSEGVKTGLIKLLPWLITAVVIGAAMGGAALAGGN